MKRIVSGSCLLFALLLCPLIQLHADEGMWLIQLMEQTNYKAMKAKGLKLKAEQIYSEEKPSLKDAIVALDYGSCTGSMISSQGLMITNHHCAYDDIQRLSTLEHDYLKYGFWAKSHKDEIPIKGKVVLFLDRVLDVTEEYKAELEKQGYKGDYPPSSTRKAHAILEKRYAKEGYEVSCSSVMRGHSYYLYYYKVYTDVRLVAAPPTCFGAFGKDTDNWNWPQHKGDFALYRVYGDKNGEPSEYHANNVPITPRYVIPVSTQGIESGDFAMILGYPYSTSRYIPSWAVTEKTDYTNPAMIRVRDTKLAILRKEMNNNTEINIKYASKYFSSSNYWKNAIGETKFVKRFKVADAKTKEEFRLAAWIAADTDRQARYGNLLEELKQTYDEVAPYIASDVYHKEANLNGSDVMRLALRMRGLESALVRSGDSILLPESDQMKVFLKYCETYFKDYDEAVDRKLFAAMLKLFADNVSPEYLAEEVTKQVDRFGGDYALLTKTLYEESFLSNREKLEAVLKEGLTLEKIQHDPFCILCREMQAKNYAWRDRFSDNRKKNTYLRTMYVKALLEMAGDRPLPPDANSTMRITYGTAGGYSPGDAVSYDFRSSIAGYPQKYVPDDPEFDLNPDCLAAISKEDWGIYADKKGKLYTGFITNQDITGGNSGSPVLNARGELIGLAYDGNWESMAGDIYYHPECNKSVCVDIRFVLWIIDKYAGASHLMKEMVLAR